jgi:hypothetical protein
MFAGGRCGSTTIDRQFQKFMEERFGEEFTKKPQKIIGPGSRLMKEFESLKRKFDGGSGSERLMLDLDWDDPYHYDDETAEVVLKR